MKRPLFFLAGVAVLAACTPSQGPSTSPQSDAISEAASSATIPLFIDCAGVPGQSPRIVSLDCIDNTERLVELSWTEWTAEHAMGRGTLRAGQPGVRGFKERKNVSVELKTPVDTPQGLVFSDVLVDGMSRPQ